MSFVRASGLRLERATRLWELRPKQQLRTARPETESCGREDTEVPVMAKHEPLAT